MESLLGCPGHAGTSLCPRGLPNNVTSAHDTHTQKRLESMLMRQISACQKVETSSHIPILVKKHLYMGGAWRRKLPDARAVRTWPRYGSPASARRPRHGSRGTLRAALGQGMQVKSPNYVFKLTRFHAKTIRNAPKTASEGIENPRLWLSLAAFAPPRPARPDTRGK